MASNTCSIALQSLKTSDTRRPAAGFAAAHPPHCCHAIGVNGAVLLLKPNWTTYALGLSVLERGEWNTTHGFELSGRPQELLRSADRTPRRTYYQTRMVSGDTWDFVAGNSDQGLFAYVS